MVQEGQRSGTTSVLNADGAFEGMRLIDQHGLVTRVMGGLFPEGVDPSRIEHVLDVACGPGSWVLDVAFAHSGIEVVGIDSNRGMVQYARARAQVQGLSNAHFMVMDALKPLDVPEQTFDLVNARFLGAVLHADAWPAFVRQCLRVLRSGGILRLTEAEIPHTSSAACERLAGLCVRAVRLAGYGFSPDDKHLVTSQVLGRLLRVAGYQQICHRAHLLDYSVGTEEYWSMYSNVKVCLELIKPLLLRMGGSTEEELAFLQRDAFIEMLSDDFRANWQLLDVWGIKPTSEPIPGQESTAVSTL